MLFYLSVRFFAFIKIPLYRRVLKNYEKCRLSKGRVIQPVHYFIKPFAIGVLQLWMNRLKSDKR